MSKCQRSKTGHAAHGCCLLLCLCCRAGASACCSGMLPWRGGRSSQLFLCMGFSSKRQVVAAFGLIPAVMTPLDVKGSMLAICRDTHQDAQAASAVPMAEHQWIRMCDLKPGARLKTQSPSRSLSMAFK